MFTNNINFTEARIIDLLCAGFEGGGIEYWATICDYELKSLPKEPSPRYLNYPLISGGAVILSDGDQKLRLDRSAIEKGLHTMSVKYLHHFDDFVNEWEEAITGDFFIQCCVFGEILYG